MGLGGCTRGASKGLLSHRLAQPFSQTAAGNLPSTFCCSAGSWQEVVMCSFKGSPLLCLLSEWIDTFWVEIPKYSCVCQPVPHHSAGSAAMCPIHLVDGFFNSSHLDSSNSLITISPRALIPWLHLGNCPVVQITHSVDCMCC